MFNSYAEKYPELKIDHALAKKIRSITKIAAQQSTFLTGESFSDKDMALENTLGQEKVSFLFAARETWWHLQNGGRLTDASLVLLGKLFVANGLPGATTTLLEPTIGEYGHLRASVAHQAVYVNALMLQGEMAKAQKHLDNFFRVKRWDFINADEQRKYSFLFAAHKSLQKGRPLVSGEAFYAKQAAVHTKGKNPERILELLKPFIQPNEACYFDAKAQLLNLYAARDFALKENDFAPLMQALQTGEAISNSPKLFGGDPSSYRKVLKACALFVEDKNPSAPERTNPPLPRKNNAPRP